MHLYVLIFFYFSPTNKIFKQFFLCCTEPVFESSHRKRLFFCQGFPFRDENQNRHTYPWQVAIERIEINDAKQTIKEYDEDSGEDNSFNRMKNFVKNTIKEYGQDYGEDYPFKRKKSKTTMKRKSKKNQTIKKRRGSNKSRGKRNNGNWKKNKSIRKRNGRKKSQGKGIRRKGKRPKAQRRKNKKGENKKLTT